MCFVLDSNYFADFRDLGNRDMAPLRNWLSGGGKIVYADMDDFNREWQGQMARELRRWRRIGYLKIVDAAAVRRRMRNLPTELESNDAHIIALAMEANAKLLVSRDKRLHADFKNPALVGGSVYQHADHKHLLRPDLCP